VHFVERPADATGGMTVAGLEGYFREVHEAYVRSPTCGFDVWFDNHYGVDMCGGLNCWSIESEAQAEPLYMDALLERLQRAEPQHAVTYRLWKQIDLVWGWLYNLYIVEPGGQTVQVNGFLRDAPADTPQWNTSLCGQGSCEDYAFQHATGPGGGDAGGSGR
jgi:hypothetical protein